MPYYCTVPRCTSMAGKDKGISFHQFPRDKSMAHLWNKILKRGKPYTKFSKVCSLHFTPNDYMTSNPDKGTWRTLRKDAVPTQNLPNRSPSRARRNSSPTQNPDYFSQYQYQNHLAQMVYLHNMMMRASSGINVDNAVQQSQKEEKCEYQDTSTDDESTSNDVRNVLTEAEVTEKSAPPSAPPSFSGNNDNEQNSYQCNDCMKIFKDPDVFTLHKRNHRKEPRSDATGGKENCISVLNTQRSRQDTLQANPILANLLTSNSNFEHHIMPAYILYKSRDDDS